MRTAQSKPNKMKNVSWVSSFLAAAAAIATLPAQAAPPGGTGNWTMTFNEDFNTLESNKWSTTWPTYNGDGSFRGLDGRTREMAYYPDSNVSVTWDSSANSSVARIRTAREDTYVPWENRTLNFTAGVLGTYTKFKQKYGYFEARVKTFDSNARGYITDFWLAPASNYYRWPPEIDIYETAGSDAGARAHLFNHYADSNGAHQYEGRDYPLDPAQWHTYAALWQPGSITWYVDGVQRGTSITRGVSAEDMYIILSTEVGSNGYWGDPWSGTWPQYMMVDYVKVWRNNNVAGNPSFDDNNANTQTPHGWSEWSNNNTADASFVEDFGGSNSGWRHLTHWKTSPYSVYTYQTRTGLRNGTYTLKAWVKSGGGQIASYIEAKDFGGSTLRTNIPATPNDYKQIVIDNIQVTNGQCTIGVYSNANAHNWIYMDDVEFFEN